MKPLSERDENSNKFMSKSYAVSVGMKPLSERDENHLTVSEQSTY